MLLLNVKEAAQRLGISSTTVRRKIKDDKFNGNAVLVGRRWKIPEDILLSYNGEYPEVESGPHWMRPPEEDAVWTVVDEFRMRTYVEGLVTGLKPGFIVVGVRKGERIVSILKLVPKEYRDRVYHFEYFQLMPKDDLQKILENKTVLLLDDTIQRGRSSKQVRDWFESQLNGKIKVYVACLFARLELKNRGQLEVPDVISYQELDDPTYRLATAQLSCYHRYLWPLDENHPMVWVEIPNTISEECIAASFGKLGRLLELPAPVPSENIKMLVVDLIKSPLWRTLGLPSTAHDWPNKKLRLIWDKDKGRLLIAGIWFPTLKASIRWLSTYHPSPTDPWYPYMCIQDDMMWKRLEPKQQALCLFNAWSIYCGTKLISIGVTELLSSFSQEFPRDINRWNVQYEDFIRSFGKLCADRIKTSIQSEISRVLEYSAQQNFNSLELPLRTNAYISVMEREFTIPDRVKPLAELLRQMAAEFEKDEDLDFEGVSYDDLRQKLGEKIDFMLDIALDYGFAKPSNLVSANGNQIIVQRVYKDTEIDASGKSGASNSAQLIEQRLYSAIDLLCHTYEDCNPGDSLRHIAFNKLLVNIQGNLSLGKINPSDRNGLSQIFVREVPREFGPMAYTPSALTPTTTLPIASFLSERGKIKKFQGDQDQSYPIVLLKPKQIGQTLMAFQEAWSPHEEKIRSDIRLLCDLHSRGTIGHGNPTKGSLLTALVACSNEKRFIFYGFNLIRIWNASGGMVMNSISQKIRNQTVETNIVPDFIKMLQTGGSLSDKTKWYRTMVNWRNGIAEIDVNPDLVMAKQRLLSRIEYSPNLEHGTKARLVMDIEPLIRLVGTMLRFSATQIGIVSDASWGKKPDGSSPRPGFQPTSMEDEPSNFPEICLALRAQGTIEIEKAQSALAQIATLGDHDPITLEIFQGLTLIWNIVQDIISTTERAILKGGFQLE